MREHSVMQEWTQIKGFGSVSNFRGCGPEISQRNSTPWGQAAVATDEISHGWERCYDFSTKKVCRPSISCFNIDMVINNKTDVNLGQTWNEAWKENVRCFFFFFLFSFYQDKTPKSLLSWSALDKYSFPFISIKLASTAALRSEERFQDVSFHAGKSSLTQEKCRVTESWNCLSLKRFLNVI